MRNGLGVSYHENGEKEYEGHWIDDVLILSLTDNELDVEETYECSICMNNICNIITKCNHQFCLECLSENFNISNKCPICRKEISVIDKISRNMKKF